MVNISIFVKLSSSRLVQPSSDKLRFALILVINLTHHPPTPGKSSNSVTCCSRGSQGEKGPGQGVVLGYFEIARGVVVGGVWAGVARNGALWFREGFEHQLTVLFKLIFSWLVQ